jgi:hypothetical protein
MKNRVSVFVIPLSVLILATGLSQAQNAASRQTWKSIELLDSQTKSALEGYERIFVTLFTLPHVYRQGDDVEKSRFVDQWIKDLNANDSEKKNQAAAYLGIAGAKSAARPLEKAVTSASGNGRLRWICTRSLGQIADAGSIPVLINLLDNTNSNTRVYAKVSLTEITGVFLSDDKEKWKNWQKSKGSQSQPKTESERAPPTETASSPMTDNDAEIEKLRRAIDRRYSYRDLRNTDWEKLFQRYGPAMRRAKTPKEFAESAAEMLANAKDMHIRVELNGIPLTVFKRQITPNYSTDILEKAVPQWHKHNEYVSTGRFPDGIGYIMITSWSIDPPAMLKPAFDALKDFSDCPRLIIDVRPNSGGSETTAQEFAGCFVDKPVVYAKHKYRDPADANGWGPIMDRTLKPNQQAPPYRGKTVVLTGRANMSSCEAFISMMKQVPGCKLVGDTTYGSSGNPKPVELAKGLEVWLPSWQALLPDGMPLEGKGIKPDLYIPTSQWRTRRQDRILENALRLLRNESGTHTNAG